MAAPLSVERRAGASPGRLGPLAQGLVLVVAMALTLGALLGVTALVSRPAASPSPTTAPVSYLVEPRAAPDLRLTGSDGRPFDLRSLRGSGVLIFFGYTHCPDVCPATIGEIFGVFEAAPQTKAVFVSVDPERDTPEWLAKWTEYLPESFDAVTGSPGAIRRAADGYGVRYARVETTSTAGYTMSHTADLFLIDGGGQLVLSFPFGTPAADIAAAIVGLPAA
jgi:cytochrome oxidase Cu insertion factor (SCO1/SenC/PrrC family)